MVAMLNGKTLRQLEQEIAFDENEKRLAEMATKPDSIEQQIQNATLEAQGRIDSAGNTIAGGVESAGQTLNPFLEGGAKAFQQQQALLGLLGPEQQEAARNQLFSSQGFLGAQDEGTRTLERQLSVEGRLNSGSRAAELQKLNANLRNQFLGQRLGQLGQIAGVGANAAGQVSGQQFAGAQGQAGLQVQGANTGLQGSEQMLQFQLGKMGADQSNKFFEAQQDAVAQDGNAQVGGLIGAGLGTAIGGPVGGWIGAGLGSALGGIF